jgi:hypothetical protein
MADWKQLANARALHIPEDQLERVGPILEALDKSFRPIAENLADDLGMAVDFQADQR